MNAYWMLIKIDIRLAFRQRVVIFFNYLMPLAFFFIFAQVYHAAEGGVILQVVAMVTVLGILGNGLFGAGMRAAQDRESNILRRYKVAPISPLPLLVASSVTGLVIYMPYVVMMLALAKWRYGMVMPRHMAEVMIFIVLGVLAIRAIGLIVASVVNSMQESQILVQILYMAMLFLSGTTIPITMFPNWLMTATQFIPATWVMTGLQGMMLRNETLLANRQAVGAMILTTVVGLFLSVKLFRWEKEEKMRPAAKLWVLAVLLPFVLLGGWQVHAKDNVSKTRIIGRDLARSHSVLIRNARIVVGDGKVIENGAVLVKEGRIAEVYNGNVPDPKTVHAETIEAAGKTILPGLIDTQVHLSGPGGFYDDWKDYDSAKMMQRNLAAYLYSGVTAVRSAGDEPGQALQTRKLVNGGEKQGAEFFVVGQLFTAMGGHGTEFLASLPAAFRDAEVPVPGSADEAKKQVDARRKFGFDGIQAVLGRFDLQIFNAIATQAQADKLPVIVNTGDAREVQDALRAHVDGVEQGSFTERIPDEDFEAMQHQGVMYDPTLSVAEGIREFAAGKLDLLNRSLVQQVGPPALLTGTRRAVHSPQDAHAVQLDIAKDNLLRAYRHGVVLVEGSGAGNVLVFHGPSVQHELQLWVDAGIPVQVALQAATTHAAKALRADARLGSIEKGKDATMLVVDGNPLVDIKATEAISFVMLKGERVDRAELLKPE
jgi:imidazolonepropionase-like amidohydrolase/ABC-type multidrug transport system permease subunit